MGNSSVFLLAVYTFQCRRLHANLVAEDKRVWLAATDLNKRLCVAVNVAMKHGRAEVVDGDVTEMRSDELRFLATRLCRCMQQHFACVSDVSYTSLLRHCKSYSHW